MSEAIKNTATQGAEQAAGTAATSTPAVTPEATKKPTGANVGVYTHKFKTPFEYGGATYEELTFNFERLTGRDMVAIETEMQMNNEYALAEGYEFDEVYTPAPSMPRKTPALYRFTRRGAK